MNTEGWMSQIDSGRLISLINIPGTHNSCTKHIALRYLCKCQNKSVYEQLSMGVRYLDLRVELSKGRLKLVHSVIDCRPGILPFKKLWLEDIIDQCARFVQKNMSETVIVNFQTDDGRDRAGASDALFGSYIFPNADLWFAENRIPFLGECRGKLILARRNPLSEKYKFDDGNSGMNLWGSESGVKNRRLIHSAVSGEVLFKVTLQDDYMVAPKRKWSEFVLPCLVGERADETTLLVNYLSANNGYNSPKITANYVNKKFIEYELKKGDHYGIICADYMTKELSEKIINSN